MYMDPLFTTANNEILICINLRYIVTESTAIATCIAN